MRGGRWPRSNARSGGAHRTAARGRVRPACSPVSLYCTQLTTLTQADVDAGIPLAKACRVLADEYQSRERLFASFGDYDRQQFARNCAAFGIQLAAAVAPPGCAPSPRRPVHRRGGRARPLTRRPRRNSAGAA